MVTVQSTQQKLGDSLPTMLGARRQAPSGAQIGRGTLKHHHAALRRAWRETHPNRTQAADVDRMKAVDVLDGSTAFVIVFVLIWAGKGSCTKMPCTWGLALSSARMASSSCSVVDAGNSCP